MATKKTKIVTESSVPNNLEKLFAICPFSTKTEFERTNFDAVTVASYPRFIIDTVNRLRQINSALESELNEYEKNCLSEERTQLEKILLEEDISKLEAAVAARENVEQEYWVDHLGKTAAIELLTLGKLSLETMTKMVKLPEDAYIEATQICVKLANAIKAATVKAEEGVGVYSAQESTSNNEPKKLNLKKIK